VVDIAKVRDAAVRRKMGCGIRRTASGRRVMKVRMEVDLSGLVGRSGYGCVCCEYIVSTINRLEVAGRWNQR
jgi:hypothetical protein